MCPARPPGPSPEATLAPAWHQGRWDPRVLRSQQPPPKPPALGSSGLEACTGQARSRSWQRGALPRGAPHRPPAWPRPPHPAPPRPLRPPSPLRGGRPQAPRPQGPSPAPGHLWCPKHPHGPCCPSSTRHRSHLCGSPSCRGQPGGGRHPWPGQPQSQAPGVGQQLKEALAPEEAAWAWCAWPLPAPAAASPPTTRVSGGS